jgi:hypothetical protein
MWDNVIGEGGRMKRIGRRALKGATGLCPLLCVATTALWINSYFAGHTEEAGLLRIHARNGDDWMIVSSFYGRLSIGAYSHDGQRVPGPHWKNNAAIQVWHKQFAKPMNVSLPRVSFHEGPSFGTDEYGTVWMDGMVWSINATHGIVLAILAALPLSRVVAAWWRWRRCRCRTCGFKYRARADRCPKCGAVPCSACGYDMRATPDRCPECGTIAPKAAQETGPSAACP